jgi:hypothetical protein
MQLFGYPLGVEAPRPLNLAEVTLLIDARTMRELAAFLTTCADQLQARPESSGEHAHFSEFVRRAMDTDLIVVPVSTRAAAAS